VSHRNPSYRLHKSTGQAVVTLNGHDHYLGKHGTPASKAEYDRLIGKWLNNGRQPFRVAQDGTLSVNELILAYFTHVQTYYRHPDGRPTSEVDNIRLALRWPKRLYGTSDAAAFDSLALDTLRGAMIRARLCRNRINKDTARIKRMFRWGAGKRLLPASVCASLATVEGLHAGRSDAVETEPVRPVEWETVKAILPHVSAQVAAMLELQYHTGARPGEIIVMRTIDLDISGPVWVYKPASHKGSWRGQERTILIGPKGQAVLRPWLRLNVQEYLFQPREAREAFDAKRRAERKTPMTPGQAQRRRKAKPKKTPGDHYTTSTYANAVAKGCKKADARLRKEATEQALRMGQEPPKPDAVFVPHFHPHQLRHAKATEIRREAGIDAARAVLGHRSPAITETDAEIDVAKAAEVMELLG
jgi:integrase